MLKEVVGEGEWMSIMCLKLQTKDWLKVLTIDF